MKKEILSIALFFVLGIGETIYAQTTEFTYQGQLQSSSAPATGSFDFEFLLFDASGGGTQIGSTITLNGVAVANGIFSVNLDFGSSFPGASRFLEIHVRQAGGGAFTSLNPRQAVSSAPYSVKSLNADTAANATQLGGVAANQYVLTSDPRMTDPRQPVAGSANYVHNTTSPQAASNFNISGTGTANILNAATQYNIGGNRVLSVAGTSNVFAGVGAGGANTTGTENSFFGRSAGLANTTGGSNSFFGSSAGQANTTGFSNSFFGFSAGQANTTGTENSFFGRAAGLANTTGTSNSFFGLNAGPSNTTGGFNAFFGRDAGFANTTGSQNSFFGGFAGFANMTGSFNSFFGQGAGQANTTGSQNAFFGRSAGSANTTGFDNAFFGSAAGQLNTTASSNSFFGHSAGSANTTGGANSFFGLRAGESNATGSNNTVVGFDADVGSGNLNFATAIGAEAVVSTSNTVLLGRPADTVQVPGNLNVAGTFTGNINGASITNLNASNISSGTLNNARLGIIPVANGGTGSATQNFVDLTTAQTVAGDKTFSNTLSGNVVNAATQYNIGGSRVLSVDGSFNVFAGVDAGANNTGNFNSFFGTFAGQANTSGDDNSFFGTAAGNANTMGDANSFFGRLAGRDSTGDDNSFFGRNAGVNNAAGNANSFFGGFAGFSNTTGDNNTIVGHSANLASGNLSFATAIGADAIVSASNAVVLGRSTDFVGIGTTAPTAKLTVVGSGAFNASNASRFDLFNSAASLGYLQHVSDAGLWQLATTAGATRMVVDSSGNVAIGINTPAQKLDVNGQARVRSIPAGASIASVCFNAAGDLLQCGASSLKWKTNVQSYRSGLDVIRRLSPISFTWKEDGRDDIGLGAEDVAKVAPSFAYTNSKGGVEGVKYERLNILLINAVNEQQTQIEAQQKQIDEQNEVIKLQKEKSETAEKQIQRQRSELGALKALVCSQNKGAPMCRPMK